MKYRNVERGPYGLHCRVSKQTEIINREQIDIVKRQFMSYLNSKYLFPLKIKRWHNKFKNRVSETNWNIPLANLIKKLDIVSKREFVNLNKEYDILKGICNEKNINYDNLVKILNLF